MNCIILFTTDHKFVTRTAGPYRLATELVDNGFSTLVLDFGLFYHVGEVWKLEYLLKNIISNETLWIGLSTTFIPPMQIPRLRKFMLWIKENFPNVELIQGGAKLMWWPVELKSFRGYSDKEIVEYTQYKSGQTKKLDLKYKNKIVEGTEYLNFVNSQIKYQYHDFIKSNDFLAIEISRGCIFKCKFCAYPLNGKKKGEWIKKAEVLREEFTRNYEQWGVNKYVYADDTHNESTEKLLYLYDNVYSKLNFPIEFSTYLRLDLLARFPEQILLLKKSGLKSAVFGIETLNHDSAKAIGKGWNPAEQIQFVRALKKRFWNDILITSGFILGLPHDTHEYFDYFEKWLFSDDNPLDSWNLSPLEIMAKDRVEKFWKSEFELDPEKYGYRFIENEEGWYNINTNISYLQCQHRVYKLLRKSKVSLKYKLTSMAHPYVRSLGISHEEILTKPGKNLMTNNYEISKRDLQLNQIKILCNHFINYNKTNMAPPEGIEPPLPVS